MMGFLYYASCAGIGWYWRDMFRGPLRGQYIARASVATLFALAVVTLLNK